MTKQSKAGRPNGAKNQKRETATARPSACPSCGSTNRTPYIGQPIEHAYEGEVNGQSYTHIVWRRTSCSDCGQARSDKSYENRPAKKAS